MSHAWFSSHFFEKNKTFLKTPAAVSLKKKNNSKNNILCTDFIMTTRLRHPCAMSYDEKRTLPGGDVFWSAQGAVGGTQARAPGGAVLKSIGERAGRKYECMKRCHAALVRLLYQRCVFDIDTDPSLRLDTHVVYLREWGAGTKAVDAALCKWARTADEPGHSAGGLAVRAEAELALADAVDQLYARTFWLAVKLCVCCDSIDERVARKGRELRREQIQFNAIDGNYYTVHDIGYAPVLSSQDEMGWSRTPSLPLPEPGDTPEN
jgi:hypothetical protein